MHRADYKSDREGPGTSKQILVQMTTARDDERPVKIVGNFNDWNLEHGAIQMQRKRPGVYEAHFPEFVKSMKSIEYRYTKGSWDDLETDKYGTLGHVRICAGDRPDCFIQDEVPRWMRYGKSYDERLLPIIEIFDENLEIPEWIKTRRIAALLPHDYYQSDRHYPVLYLQDGQNLFDDYAPFGTWAVDKRLAVMAEEGFHKCIVIAIDHAAEQRIAEFTPSHHTRLGVGEGKKYVNFIAETLKPYVDNHFRTLPHRDHTGIGGSSMGGLVSLYAGLLFPEIYSKLMIFSPSLWVDPDIMSKSAFINRETPFKLYLYAGMQEGSNLIKLTNKLEAAILEHSRKNWRATLLKSIHPLGKHNESDWGREFPKALKWLFFENQ